MHLRGVLDDGEAQSATTRFFRAAFIDAIEALEHTLAELRRNADARIAHTHDSRSVSRSDNCDPRAPAFNVVANRVFNKVAHHLAQNLRVSAHDHGLVAAALNLARERHRVVFRIRTQALARVIRKRFERNALIHIDAQIIARCAAFSHVVELRERNNVVNHAAHALRFAVDGMRERPHVFVFRDAGSDDFRITRNNRERRLELVRHVRRILAALARLGLEALMLRIKPREQRGKLDRRIRFKGSIQIDSHKIGRNDLRQKARPNGRRDKRERHNHGAGPQHMQHHAPHARLRSGETQHIVIVKANGMVKRDLLQGFRIAARAAFAIELRLNEFGATGMALEGRHIDHVVVEEHRAIARDKRDAHVAPHKLRLLIKKIEQFIAIELGGLYVRSIAMGFVGDSLGCARVERGV